ncbi:uncharacterized protein LOC118289169 isoform X1 [Scophthalmus maximus]|uniref:uncharacterized protein LOC118289169 isoform X1 n=2 Tax=Scophthalmus maximus TaxID=52904 RepID=UPI0015E0A6E8|nr:uncharacterized protein LOC118289169 isoform X1 [Scophthalmus maximus]
MDHAAQRGPDDLIGSMDADLSLLHCGRPCHSKAKTLGVRRLHQTTLSLGDTEACYTTTHTESFSGRSSDGRPLTFHLRDASFPSQHHTRDTGSSSSVITPLAPPPVSHTTDVHGPKHVTPRANTRTHNWARYCSGRAVRDITNPQEPSQHRTTYTHVHALLVDDGSTQRPVGGTATQWHRHNILTGEQNPASAPSRSNRLCRDELLWAARPWETDCTALRLH